MLSKLTRQRLLASTTIAGLAAVGFAGAAFAQDSSGSSAAQEVVVTGSRLARKDFTAISPVTTVSSETLALTATTSVEALLNELPQVIPGNTFTSNNAGGENFATVDLRGLGPSRTLVLINGERVPPSSTTGAVNLDTIPATLIDHIEVVTGGASTVYGSDALGGVVNFVLRQNYEGAEINASYSETGDGKAPATSISALLGGNFANGRGNLTAYASYFNRDSVSQSEYDFSKVSAEDVAVYNSAGNYTGVDVVNSAAQYNALLAKAQAAGGGLAALVSGGSATPPWGVVRNDPNNPFTGLSTNPLTPGFASVDSDCNPATANVTGSSAGGVSFNNAGKLTPVFSSKACGVPDRAAGSSRYNFAPTNLIILPEERYSFQTFGRYQVTDNITAKVNLSFTDSKTGVQLAPTPVTTPDITFVLTPAESALIQSAHPDLYAALQSRPNPNAPFTEGLRTNFLGPRIGTFDDTAYSLLTTLDGKINEHWSWSATASYGHTSDLEVLNNNANKQALFEAASGCTSTAGNPITGSTVLGLIPCVPLDPYGPNNSSAGIVNFLRTNTKTLNTYSEQRLAAFVRGDLFNLPAGPVAIVLGTEYRDDKASIKVDDQQHRGDIYGFNATQDQGGGVDVYELYGEAAVPILAKLPFIKYFGLEAGYRYSDYSSAGNVNTYKLGFEWSVNDWIKFRGIYNKATRAPSVFELFQNGDQGFIAYIDPCNTSSLSALTGAALTARTNQCLSQRAGTAYAATLAGPTGFSQINAQTQQLTFGNQNLKPETADTYTAGLVLTPDLGAFGKVRATVDYYNIKIRNEITNFGGLQYINDCYAGTATSAASCAQLSYSSTGDIESVNGGTTNSLGAVKTSGEDVQIEYSEKLSSFPYMSSIPGTLRLSELFSYTNTYTIDGASIVGTEAAAIGGSLPRWKSVFSGFYTVGDWTTFVRWSYVPELTQSNFTGFAPPKAPAASYVDAAVSWNATDLLKVTLTVDNIFDKRAPQLADGVLEGQANTDAQLYSQGILGRVFAVTLRARF